MNASDCRASNSNYSYCIITEKNRVNCISNSNYKAKSYNCIQWQNCKPKSINIWSANTAILSLFFLSVNRRQRIMSSIPLSPRKINLLVHYGHIVIFSVFRPYLN